jgi:hypothetical protein
MEVGSGLFLGLQRVDSIGRDRDWTTHGGWNSKGLTPSKRNYGLDLPVINK